MKIVILDGFTAVRNDLNWDMLNEFGEVIAYDRTSPNQTAERCADAEIVLTNKVIMNADIINALPKLKYIGVLATGYNVVDLEATKQRGIVVTNIPAYSTDSVAQLIFAHLLNVVHRIDYYTNENHNGRWSKEIDVNYLDHSPCELAGKQIAFIGLGNIGITAIRIAQAFGMKPVVVTSRPESDMPENVRKVSYEEAFSTSDIISLTCPLNEKTKHLINEKTLNMMQPHAIVINTSRGPIVDDNAMAEALKSGKIAAFCTDVLTQEPPVDGNPLFGAPNCYITPHVAWATFEARKRLVNICADNVRAFINGTPKNVVMS